MSAAVTRMLSFAKKYGKDMISALNNSPVFFPVMLVQASNESGYGTSYSAVHRNNFFGIMEGGHKKVFSSPQDCFNYYANLLSGVQRYVNAGVPTATDPYKQMRAIADAGYYDANNDDNLPASQRPPNKRWTAKQSADRYYSINKLFLDEILLKLPIGRINDSTVAQAQTSLANLTSMV